MNAVFDAVLMQNIQQTADSSVHHELHETVETEGLL